MEIIVIVLVIVVLLAAETISFRLLSRNSVSYDIHLGSSVAYEGETVEIIEEIRNLKFLPLPWLKTEICTERWLEFAGTTFEKTSEIRFVPSIFSLRPYQKCRRVWTARCVKRGSFSLSTASVIMSDLFGLVNVSLEARCEAELTVLPAPLAAGEVFFSDRELYGEKIIRRFICEDMSSVSGIREYTGLEPMRSISWKGSARENRLMVCKYDYTTSNRVLIVLNTLKNDIGSTPARLREGETLIKAAALVLEEINERSDSVDFISNLTGTPLYHGKSDILTALAELEFGEGEDLPRFLASLADESYTDIVLLTSAYGERAADAVDLLRSKGVFVSVMTVRNECGEPSAIQLSIPEKFC